RRSEWSGQAPSIQDFAASCAYFVASVACAAASAEASASSCTRPTRGDHGCQCEQQQEKVLRAATRVSQMQLTNSSAKKQQAARDSLSDARANMKAAAQTCRYK